MSVELTDALTNSFQGKMANSNSGRTLGDVLANTGWSIVDYGSGRLLSFAGVVYIARMIGTDAFGIYSVFVSAAQAIAVFTELGTASYGTREIAQQFPNHGRAVRSITYLRVSLALAVTAGCCLAVWLVPALKRDRYVVVAICGYLMAFSMSQDWYYAGLRLFRPIALSNLCKAAVFTIGCLLLVKSSSDLPRAVAIYAAAPLVATAVLTAYSCRSLRLNPFGRLDHIAMLYNARRSAAFAGMSVGVALYGAIPVYILAWVGSMKEVGMFSAAQRPVLIAASVALPLASSFYPFICQSYADPEKFRASQALFQHVVLILTIPAAILGVANGDYVMHLLYGTSYMQAHGPFRIMSLVIPLSAMRLAYTHPLLASHRQGVAAAIAFKAGAATALLVCVFFLAFGLTGAAWAVVLGEALFTTLVTIYAYRLLRIPPYTSACRPVLLGACLMVLLMLIPGPRAVTTIVSASAYAAAILRFDGLGKEVLMAVLNRITKSSIGEGTVA